MHLCSASKRSMVPPSCLAWGCTCSTSELQHELHGEACISLLSLAGLLRGLGGGRDMGGARVLCQRLSRGAQGALAGIQHDHEGGLPFCKSTASSGLYDTAFQNALARHPCAGMLRTRAGYLGRLYRMACPHPPVPPCWAHTYRNYPGSCADDVPKELLKLWHCAGSLSMTWYADDC